MSRRRTDPLRALSDDERRALERLSRSHRAAAARVARATALLAVADGQSHSAAARRVGRRDGDTVAAWVARFNREGLAAVRPARGGGRPVRYADAQQRRILAEAARVPDRERDGTATWSLGTLRGALRRAAGGLPTASTDTIWRTLREAGLSWQRSRAWCATGTVVRRRRHGGAVPVTGDDAAAKKVDRAGLRARPAGRPGGLVRGRGRAVPGRPASRRRRAADRTAGDPAARVRAPGHDQDPDPVPSRDRPGAGPAGDPRHERGPARLAEGDPGGGRGGAAGRPGGERPGGDARPLGGLAAGPSGALHPARAAPPAEGPAGVGQPRRPQDARDGAVVVPARHHAALHAPGRQLVEHGRVDPAHPQTPGARGAAAAEPGRDRRLVRADGRQLELAAHALRLERQAPAATAETGR